ncbi:GUN4 domain-containing protein [Nodularia sphaerocarpa CS-585]|nr:GUN4 domain-containing protein [Nodularia sphaerocarpa]MDB9373569.1 GUN4 domain-containing protein [Nodularia sphaerocarpa CS-585]MDB9379472.1 GUN4 domain-containing protein [Nodularia sphaerocarpa CS-585A2]
MLTKKPRQLISYKSITIYEKVYQLPIFKSATLKKIQRKIRYCRKLVKEGVRYHSYFWGIIQRKQKITQKEIFAETQILIKDYTHLIDILENYQDSYQDFLLKLRDDWKKLFVQKYLEIKQLNEETQKLELKNQTNYQIIEQLKWEKQENLKSTLLLRNTYFLMLEKIKLLSEGIKTLAEDYQIQKQNISKIVKELDLYQELYEYQQKAEKIRQEIATIADSAINFETYAQVYFSPFQSLIDEVVKVDQDFYATVEDIQNLANNIFKYQSNLLTIEEPNTISETFLDFMVASYEKKERLKDAFTQVELLNSQVYNFEFTDEEISSVKSIDLISSYISHELVDQSKLLGITAANFVSPKPISLAEETEFVPINEPDFTLTKQLKINPNIDYNHLQNLLAQHKWQEADIETTKLMLQIMGKNYWNEVYKEDIDKFPCQDFHTIDQLWGQYSYGYFGFSVQQSIWSEIGGQVDYETEKKLGDRLGWRKDGNWLKYDQLTFQLSPTTPMGHLPVKWLHYDQDIQDILDLDLSSNSSAESLSMGAWRVGSWLLWQMHLFFSRVKICNTNLI